MDLDISQQLIAIFKSSCDPWGIKLFKENKTYYYYCNEKQFDLLNLPKNYSIEGKTDEEIPHHSAEFAENFQNHDAEILKKNTNILSIDTYYYGRKSELQPYFCEKYPYVHNGECIGVVFHSKKACLLNLRSFLNIRYDNKKNTKIKTILTKREFEVASLFTHSYAIKEIARLLFLSPYTISNIINSIYNKLGISSRKQLSDILCQAAMRLPVPPGILKVGSVLSP